MTTVPMAKRSVDLWYVLSVVALSSVFTIFAAANFLAWQRTGHPVGLGLMAQEAIAALLFIVRRRPMSSSRSLSAWAVTGFASFGMLAARPDYDPLAGLGGLYTGLQFVGVAIAAVSLACLGRSFGLVPANRGIKIGGAYRIVRHPAYAGYLVSYTGYLLENPSIWNLAVLCVAVACQLVRIGKEEEFLGSDPVYAEYLRRVRYRLIPFVY